jgi:hypothetical protein
MAGSKALEIRPGETDIGETLVGHRLEGPATGPAIEPGFPAQQIRQERLGERAMDVVWAKMD